MVSRSAVANTAGRDADYAFGRRDPSGTVRLHASRDRASGRCVFPRIPDSSPAAPRFQPVELSASATLYSYTVIHPNPKSGAKPFVLAYADFAEGARVLGRLKLAEGERPVIGMVLMVDVAETAPDAPLDSPPTYVFVPLRGERK